MIRVPAQHNARTMLDKLATTLGTFGDDAYYFLDGMAWRMTGGTVYRSDDNLESAAILRMCRDAGFPGNRPCTGCNTQFAIDARVGAHRRGYCSDECENGSD